MDGQARLVGELRAVYQSVDHDFTPGRNFTEWTRRMPDISTQ
jgi:hypothetical protein